MPVITDWLMVGITIIYVVATIFICWANIKSANASKEQLQEMQRQYDEKNRPIIEVELIYERKAFYGLRFVNHGMVTANCVKIYLDAGFIESIEEADIKYVLEKQNSKECVIGVGQHYKMYFGTNAYRNTSNKIPAQGYITYQGNGKEYRSDFYIDLEKYATFYSVNSEHDDWKNWMKDLNSNIKELNMNISQLKHKEKKGDDHVNK